MRIERLINFNYIKYNNNLNEDGKKMKFERKVLEIGGSIAIIIPRDMAEYLDLKINTDVILQDEENKKGQKYASFWKKE